MLSFNFDIQNILDNIESYEIEKLGSYTLIDSNNITHLLSESPQIEKVIELLNIDINACAQQN